MKTTIQDPARRAVVTALKSLPLSGLAAALLASLPMTGAAAMSDDDGDMKRMGSRILVLKGFVMEADQERRTMNRVMGWLDEVQVKG